MVFVLDDALFVYDLTFEPLEVMLSRADDIFDSVMIRHHATA